MHRHWVFAVLVAGASCVMASPARATCGNLLTCKLALVQADCSAATSDWPADQLLWVKVRCSDYCSYLDPTTGKDESYTRDDVPPSEVALFLTVSKSGKGPQVEGAFEDQGKSCGGFHLLRFDTLLDADETYIIDYPTSSLMFKVVAASGEDEMVGCSFSGPKQTAAASAAALPLLVLALLFCARRGRH